MYNSISELLTKNGIALLICLIAYFTYKVIICYYFKKNPFGFLKRAILGETAPPASGYKIPEPEPPIKNFNEISENINKHLNDR